VATLFADGEADRTSFVGEIGINGGVRLTGCLALMVGYRMLWIDSVALVSDQLANTDFFDGEGYDGSGSVFYHGAFVGVDLRH
jgi:hypothetical protein